MGNIDSVDYYDYYVEALKKASDRKSECDSIWDLIRKILTSGGMIKEPTEISRYI